MMEGPGADSEEKHEPVSDIDTAVVVVGLKALDPEWPIGEAIDPTVWTGRVLQARCERWRGLVLRFCIRPVNRAFMLLAIMDIRAHPISFSERP